MKTKSDENRNKALLGHVMHLTNESKSIKMASFNFTSKSTTVYVILMNQSNEMKMIRISNHAKGKQTDMVPQVTYRSRTMRQAIEDLENKIYSSRNWVKPTLEELIVLNNIVRLSYTVKLGYSKRRRENGKDIKGDYFYTIDKNNNKVFADQKTSAIMSGLLDRGILDYAKEGKNIIYLPHFVYLALEEFRRREPELSQEADKLKLLYPIRLEFPEVKEDREYDETGILASRLVSLLKYKSDIESNEIVEEDTFIKAKPVSTSIERTTNTTFSLADCINFDILENLITEE